METFDAIQKRCSLKTRLSGRAVEPEKINMVLEAGRLAPSARNSQPWRFLVVHDKAVVESLVDAVFFEPCSMCREAPAIIIVCARPEDDVAHGGRKYYLFDAGLAVQNMLLAATDLGLVTHPLISFDETELKKRLQIPEEVQVVIATPLAYPTAASYDDAAKDRLGQRARKSLNEITYGNRWKTPYSG